MIFIFFSSCLSIYLILLSVLAVTNIFSWGLYVDLISQRGIHRRCSKVAERPLYSNDGYPIPTWFRALCPVTKIQTPTQSYSDPPP